LAIFSARFAACFIDLWMHSSLFIHSS